jgi:hypothetical protein
MGGCSTRSASLVAPFNFKHTLTLGADLAEGAGRQI